MSVRLAALGALVLLAAGCGGGAATGTRTSGVAGTVATLTTSPTFRTRMTTVQHRLESALQQVERGHAPAAATILSSCAGTVTRELGPHARTPIEQQDVSLLRAACADATESFASLETGETTNARALARQALREVGQATIVPK